MLIRIIAAAAAIALSASPLYAGMTSSRTIVPADEPAVCDNTIFDYAANYSASWAIGGEVTQWFMLTEPNIAQFIILWNNTHPDALLPDVAFNEVVAFKIPEGSSLGPAGEYAFLYLDGCYVADVYSPPPPDNVSAPPPTKNDGGPLVASAAFRLDLGAPATPSATAGADWQPTRVHWDSLNQWRLMGQVGLR